MHFKMKELTQLFLKPKSSLFELGSDLDCESNRVHGCGDNIEEEEEEEHEMYGFGGFGGGAVDSDDDVSVKSLYCKCLPLNIFVSSN